MAYCRFSDSSDVYLVQTLHPDTDEWECFNCQLDPDREHRLFHSLFKGKRLWAVFSVPDTFIL